jgi:DHA2 family multidrug resistance protein
MNQPNHTTTSDTKNINIPKYLIISILTIFSIGPQYFLNASYILNQIVIQNRFSVDSHEMLLPSIVSNLAFTLCVPIGPIIARKYGLRNSYLTFILIFLCGSIINALSPQLTMLIIGRMIQGLSAGALFLTILPVSLISFPNKIRNQFLLLAIGGLFGSSAVGAFFGSLSLSIDAWRWLFVINIYSSLLCLLIGYAVLPKHQPQQHHNLSIDKWGALLLSLAMIILVIPLINLQEMGFSSGYVWPFFLMDTFLLAMFLTIDLYAENPLVPIRSLLAAKPIFGTIMAVSSNVALIVALAGINGFLRSIIDTPFDNLAYFYVWFFVGIMASAVLSTLLYDKLGPGTLGFIGSLAVIFVAIQWRVIGEEASLTTLYMQIFCLGGGVSMTLISGALGTALAGDIHKAPMRSVSLHFIRNFISTIVAPVLGWFLYRQIAIYYENIRGQISEGDLAVTMKMTELTQQFFYSGLSTAEAKELASYSLMMMIKKVSLTGAYHDLFTTLLLLGVIMMIASIGKAVTGKGRSLVQKEAPKSDFTPLPASPQQQKDGHNH